METLDANFIALLRELFTQMETSRGRLRPILADIAASIEQGFFIDADSEEVNALLKRILDAQEKFLAVEQTRKSANSKKIEQLDKTLSELEQNSKREELVQVLSKILTLVLDSDEPLMVNSLRQVKLQAERLKNTAGKVSAENFEKAAEKFVLLNEIVDSGKNISTEDYLEAVSKFPDNPILLMILSQGKLHFPNSIKVDEPVVDEKSDEVEVADDDEKDKPSVTVTVQRVNAVNQKFKKIMRELDLSLVIYNQADFEIEKSASKKNFTVKSFNNKLHEIADSSDPEPIFKVLMNTRIFFKQDTEKIKLAGKFTKKLIVFIPTVLERIFTWGIVDKVTWRGIQFYYLNNFGFELCQRMFKISGRNSNTAEDENDFETMINALKIAWMKIAEPQIRGNFKMPFVYHEFDSGASASIRFRVADGETHAFLMLSLNLIGDDWIFVITKYKCYIELEMELGTKVKGVFIFAAKKSDLPWIKFFDTIKFKEIALFLCTPEGLFDKTGNEVDFKDLREITRLGLPDPVRKKGKRTFFDLLRKTAEKMSLFDEDFDEKNSDADVSPDKDFDTDIFSEDIFLETDKNIFFDKQSDTAETPAAVEIIDLPSFDESVSDDKISEVAAESSTEIADEVSVPVEEIPAVEPSEETVTPAVVEITSEPSKKVESVDDNKKTSANDIAKVDGVIGITNLFRAGESARGMLALHALKNFIAQSEPDTENWAENLTVEIGFIIDDPIVMEDIQGVDTFDFWTNVVEIPKANIGKTFDYLALAAMIKNFFAPPQPAGYQLQKSWRQINEDKSNKALKEYPAAKNLISLFNNFTEKTHNAFADCLVGAGTGTEDNFRRAVAQIKNVENIVDSVLHSDVNHRRVKDVINQLFTNNGYLRKYLNSIEDYKPAEILEFCRQFEDTDLTAVMEDANAKITEDLFSEKKIDDMLDYIWNNPQVQLVRKEREPFKGPKRKKVTGVFFQCLQALLGYIHAKKNLDNSFNSGKQAAPVEKALEILNDLQTQINRADKKQNLGQMIFKIFAGNLKRKLNGENVTLTYENCLLTSNYIELENGMPTINSFGVEEFSLKNRVMNFESEMKGKTFGDVLKNAYENALRNYDCGILMHLAKFFLPKLEVTDEEIKRKISALDRQVDKQIDRVYNDFLNDLELARNYSRITDQEKIEFYINAAVDARKHFMQTKNAGLFQRFINACNESISKSSIPHRKALENRLKKLEDSLEKNLNVDETLDTRYPILAEVQRQIKLMNLTVAEDYMNRLETEGGNLLTELDVNGADLSTLENFLNEYETLYRAVDSANVSVENVYRQRIHGKINRESQNALDFLHGWQGLHSGQNQAIELALIDILSHLGYGNAKIFSQNVDTINQKSYTVIFDEPIKARENFPHPFAVFGTEIYSKGLEIIYLGANRKWENIAQVLGEMTADRGVICLSDISMTLPERRSLAKIMKLTANLKNILVLDKVAALYLARFDDATRGKRMLQTLLPFARVQPYTTGGVVAPEMFIGRSEELDQIRDMRGPVFVYGGRQLGKSALLRQVRNLEHNPRQLNYAFFIDLKNLNSDQTLKKIVYELSNAKLIGEVQDWDEFSFKMHKLLDGQLRGIEKPKKLLLLMDESDSFLSEKTSEAAINVLRELLVTFNGQFKFVLAGLHKVIRFEQNSSFGNLNHISVLPFRPSDAMELLVKPMSYLGFRVSDDSLISAIFSRTNYYPGSIQYYCKMLVDAVGANYTKQNFDVVKNPPYTLDDEYLKNVLGNREFQEEIKNKFQITLCLDDDNYYEILALAVAMAYYENGRPIGVSLSDIKDYCLMCGVEKIGRLSDAEILSLLDEMVTLNILRRADGKFEFNRYAFWHMMGTVEEANKKLDSYGTIGARA